MFRLAHVLARLSQSCRQLSSLEFSLGAEQRKRKRCHLDAADIVTRASRALSIGIGECIQEMLARGFGCPWIHAIRLGMDMLLEARNPASFPEKAEDVLRPSTHRFRASLSDPDQAADAILSGNQSAEKSPQDVSLARLTWDAWRATERAGTALRCASKRD